jgi:methionyl aminopeptidase
MSVLRTLQHREAMRRSGRIAARVRDAVLQACAPGVVLRDLERLAEDMIRREGAESAFKGYQGYPAAICLSLNDEVVHGIPDDRRIQPGDIVSLDVGVRYGGWVGDCAWTILVGVTDAAIRRLAAVGEEALRAGISAARAGRYVTDISRAIQEVVEQNGFSVVRRFVGHGIGRRMHEEPQVPNFVAPDAPRIRLQEGMALAIEPMVNLGTSEVTVGEDGWTVRTADGAPSVHFEHTIVVGTDGAEILTS